MNRRYFTAGLFFLPGIARAHSTRLGDIAIGHSWALPSRLTDGQVFFPLVNNGEAADQLIAARSDICGLIELRQNNRYNDPPLKSIMLEPHKPVPMRPTARHLRLAGLKKPLNEYDNFNIILDFLNAGEVEIAVLVEIPGN